jgi:AcrR family transcriptional regulator
MMKRKYRLSPATLAAVEQDLASDKPKIQRRAQAMLRLHEGWTVTDIAKAAGVSRQAVYTWIDHYAIPQDYEQFKQELVRALVEALQEHPWCFEDLHAALEQRLGRSIEPVRLRSWIMVARDQIPTLYPVLSGWGRGSPGLFIESGRKRTPEARNYGLERLSVVRRPLYY